MRSVSLAVLVLVFSALAVGQSGIRSVPGYCSYGCGPFIPLVTTPTVSLETVRLVRDLSTLNIDQQPATASPLVP